MIEEMDEDEIRSFEEEQARVEAMFANLDEDDEDFTPTDEFQGF